MNNNITKLFTQLKLAFTPPIHLVDLTGGKQHQTIKVTDAAGLSWVVKKLNRNCWLGNYSLDYFKQVEHLAFKVESLTQQTVSAFSFNDRIIHSLEVGDFIILPWVEGDVCFDINLSQAELLGDLLAKIHQLQLDYKGFQPFQVLNDKFLTNKISSDYCKLLTQCNQTLSYQSEQFILSHRDINLSNVIWCDENQPMLVDWESAGLIHPLIELIGLALNCAGAESGQMSWDKFNSSISAYKQNISLNLTIDDSLYNQTYYTWFAWMDYCLRCQHHNNTDEEIELCLTVIQILRDNKGKIISLINC